MSAMSTALSWGGQPSDRRLLASYLAIDRQGRVCDGETMEEFPGARTHPLRISPLYRSSPRTSSPARRRSRPAAPTGPPECAPDPPSTLGRSPSAGERPEPPGHPGTPSIDRSVTTSAVTTPPAPRSLCSRKASPPGSRRRVRPHPCVTGLAYHPVVRLTRAKLVGGLADRSPDGTKGSRRGEPWRSLPSRPPSCSRPTAGSCGAGKAHSPRTTSSASPASPEPWEPARSGLRRRAARRVHTPAGSPSSRLPGLLHRCGRRRPTLTAAGHRPSPCRVRHPHPRLRRRLRRGRHRRHPGLGPGDADRPVVHRRDRPRPHRSRGRHGTRVRAEAVPPPDVEGGDPGRRPARHLPLRRLLRHRLALLHPPAFLAAVATTFQETSLGGGVATFLLYAAGMGSVLAVLSVAVAIAHRQVVTAMNGSCPTSTGPRADS